MHLAAICLEGYEYTAIDRKGFLPYRAECLRFTNKQTECRTAHCMPHVAVTYRFSLLLQVAD